MPMASRMPGIASSTSTPRISRLSTLPPAAPATAPMRPPSVTPTMTDDMPARRLTVAPYMTRLSSSRPCLSWPNGCAALGGQGPSFCDVSPGGGGNDSLGG